jgi:hypothetical protein
MTPYPIPQQEGQFDVVIEMTDSDGVLHGNLKYQTDRFSPDTARDMRDALVGLLTAVTERPDAPVSELVAAEQREDFEL